MSGFDAGWLTLREPFDHAARSMDLARRFLGALDPVVQPRLIDLGAGTGANFRVLAPLIERDQSWILLDYDASLLACALESIAAWAAREGWRSQRLAEDAIVVLAGARRWSVSTRPFDLSGSLEQLPIETADAIVTTAFLDLISQAWVDAFADRLARAPRPFLATLTVDGRRLWSPPIPGDRLIDEAFRSHQAGDKGFGASLGPGAAMRMSQALCERGFVVHERGSNWQIRAQDHPAMIARMLDETAEVACEVHAGTASMREINHWVSDRRARIQAGILALEVGHQDLLALPAAV